MQRATVISARGCCLYVYTSCLWDRCYSKCYMCVKIKLISKDAFSYKIVWSYLCAKFVIHALFLVRLTTFLPTYVPLLFRAVSCTGHNLFAYICPTTVQGRIWYGPQPFGLHISHYCSGPYLVRATTFCPAYIPLLFRAVSGAL